MTILCILQNAWGDKDFLPVTFVPNPFNKSAKTIKKMVGDNFFMFSNTTDVVTRTSREKPKPNYEHFERVIKRIKYFDLVLVCGKQAEETVKKYMVEIEAQGKPVLFIPHPAARNLTNEKCNEIREQVRKYEEDYKN